MKINKLLKDLHAKIDQELELIKDFQDKNVEDLELEPVTKNIYVDGAGFNGKVSRYAVFMRHELVALGTFEENYTNNEMEYFSAIKGMLLANEGDKICSDSKLVVEQIIGGYKCVSKNLILFNDLAKQLLIMKKLKIMWVARAENKAGVMLDNTK